MAISAKIVTEKQYIRKCTNCKTGLKQVLGKPNQLICLKCGSPADVPSKVALRWS